MLLNSRHSQLSFALPGRYQHQAARRVRQYQLSTQLSHGWQSLACDRMEPLRPAD